MAGRHGTASARAAGLGLAALAGLAALGATGTVAGASTPTTPAGLLHASIEALAGSSTLTMRGTVVQGGTRVGLDLRITGGGANTAGVVTLGSAKAGAAQQQIDFFHLGSRLELRANEQFWVTQAGKQLPKSVIAKLSGRWVIVPPSEAKSLANDLSGFTSPKKLAASLLSGPATGVKFGPTSTVDGVRVRAVEDVADSARVEIPVAGSPRPVQIVGSAGGSGGNLHFTYPAHLTLTPPKAVALTVLIGQALAG